MGGFIDQITGKAGAEAAKDAAAVQAQAGRDALAQQQAQFEFGIGRTDPFVQAGQGAIGQYVDTMQNYQQDPFYQQQLDRQLEAVNRQAASQGGLGGGARLKRIMQEANFNAMQGRQNTLDNQFRLGTMGANMAGNQANLAANFGNQQAGLTTGIGAAQAGGIVGAANARSAGAGNLLGLGMMAAGAGTGNPALALGGANKVSGSEVGSNYADWLANYKAGTANSQSGMSASSMGVG